MKQYITFLALLSFLTLPAFGQSDDLERLTIGSLLTVKKELVIRSNGFLNDDDRNYCQVISVFSKGVEILGPVELSVGQVLKLKKAEREYIGWDGKVHMGRKQVVLDFSTASKSIIKLGCMEDNGYSEPTIGTFKKDVLGTNAKLSKPKPVKI